MNFRTILAAAGFAVSCSAFAADSPGETTIKLVQEQLHRLGLYTGPIDGKLEGDAQAALAQFQLSQLLPASGGLDDETLHALGVQREQDASAAAGGSAPSEASPEQKVD